MTVPGAVFAKGNGDDEDNKQGCKANNGGLTEVGMRDGRPIHNQVPLQPEGVLRVAAQQGDHALS